MDLNALVQAARIGDEQTVRALLSAGVAADNRGGTDWTPLMAAASNGHLTIMEVLLEHGAEVDAISRSGFTALTWACCQPNLQAVALLLNAGADPNHESRYWTPLMYASNYRYMQHAKLLLEAGADIDAKETGPRGRGRTALDLAERTPAMREFLQREINRRKAAALSVMPSRLPKEIRKNILELIRKR